ncbi:MAG: hypothetical protein QXG10_00885 [Candidatus Hadarchaeales archaeon]
MLEEGAAEELEKVISELKEMASRGISIIVEGEEDVKALAEINITGDVRKISGHGSLLNFIECFSGHEEVIILADFDRAGEELARFCEKHLKSIGVRPNTEIRKKLKGLLTREARDIPGVVRTVRSCGISCMK